jgi:hypothetical protein
VFHQNIVGHHTGDEEVAMLLGLPQEIEVPDVRRTQSETLRFLLRNSRLPY